MNKIKLIITVLFSLLVLTSCASIQQHKSDWIKKYCNPKTAFDSGVRDAKNNNKPFYSFVESGNLHWCGSHIDRVRARYLQGYQSVDAAQPAELPALAKNNKEIINQKNTTKTTSDTVVVHFN